MGRKIHSSIPDKIDMDDGSFPMAHTALLTLSKTRLSGAQRAVVDVIFTQTYGYHNEASPHHERIKKRHTRARISNEFFAEVTWMGKQEVSRAIAALLKWNIIGRDKSTSPYTYWFNVYSSEWLHECWRVSRIANSKQDSELAGQLTLNKQDSEQSVSRIANNKRTSAQESQGLAPFLKKQTKKDQSKVSSSLTTTTGQSPEEVVDKTFDKIHEAPPTNKDLIAELTGIYRGIGIQETKGDYAFIGALYNAYGYDQVLTAINKLQMAVAVQKLRKPLLYLKGILEKQGKDPPRNVVAPTPIDNKKTELIKSLYMN